MRARRPSHPAHPGLLATCSAAPVGPEMGVARVKNSPEPAEHGLQLGAALDAATRRRLTFARLLPFAPLPRGDGTAFRRGLHDGQVGDASWASSQTKQETFLMAGRARNTDGTHPRASSGARSVVSGPFSEACSWHSLQ